MHPEVEHDGQEAAQKAFATQGRPSPKQAEYSQLSWVSTGYRRRHLVGRVAEREERYAMGQPLACRRRPTTSFAHTVEQA